ncbi:methyltransferase [Thalassobaculum fulvum]|jgi:SAM-dependent methyltransferase|uniref:Methyltransferase n=1 Tax=Thalassobaculum fulvum TaxID=1633335 RepID=A0A918XND1_9PROT|nr:class I SAM-dependent methyltransferase [Thalassobaculum fulvum]GHD41471.1 methyltransferase [Thalassobaculum fulvum]
MSKRTEADTQTAHRLAELWEANAALWARAISEGRIPSRRQTDTAILTSISRHGGGRVLDLGCGEGWLVRRLSSEVGCQVTGIDGSPALIGAARRAHPGGDYRHMTYADFVAAPEAVGGSYDAVVVNFALFDDLAHELLAAAASRLTLGGALIVQTLHPWSSAADDYRHGWRIENFADIATEGEAWVPVPWYFRTLEGWVALVRDAGLTVADLREPRDAQEKLLSLLLVGRRTR